MNGKDKWRYRGWQLVETGFRYYSACKGSVRAGIGMVHHGDWAELTERFKRKVDELEGDAE